MKKLLIVGETSAGKDYFAKYLEAEYDLKPVVSYATRPMRKNETQGIQHKFITDEEALKIFEDTSNHIIAYTKIGEYQYFATLDDLNNADMYIIDPNGIEYLKEHYPEVDTYVVYITCSKAIRRCRAVQRGDDIDALSKRMIAEQEQFDNFTDYDAMYINQDGLKELENFADRLVKELENQD